MTDTKNKLIVATQKGVRPTPAALPEHMLAANVKDRRLFTNHKGTIIELNDAGSYDAKTGGGELEPNVWVYIDDSDNYTLPEITADIKYQTVRVRVDNGNTPIIACTGNDKIKFRQFEDVDMTFTGDSIVEFIALDDKWIMIEFTVNGEGGSGSANQVRIANSEEAMLNVIAVEGDVTIRSDLEVTYIHNGGVEQAMSSWELQLAGVQSINGKSPTNGNVVLGKADVGLDKVENFPISDQEDLDSSEHYASSKAVSTVDAKTTANATAIETKADQTALDAHLNDSSNPHGVTAADLGLDTVQSTLANHTADLLTKASKTSVTAVENRATDLETATVNLNTALTDHIARTDNPHNVTAAQLNLENVDNFPTSDSITSINPAQNASSLAVKTVNDRVTQSISDNQAYVDSQIQQLLGGAPKAALDTIKELGDELETNQSAISTITTSLASKATQVGLDAATARITANENDIQTLENTKATNAALTSHATDTDNPHNVNAQDVGLGNVPNFPSSSSVVSDSTTTNATSRAVKVAHDKGEEALAVANAAIGKTEMAIPAGLTPGWNRLAVGTGLLSADFQIVGRDARAGDIKFHAGVVDGNQEGAVITVTSATAGSNQHRAFYNAFRIVSLDADTVNGLKALEVWVVATTTTSNSKVVMFNNHQSSGDDNWQIINPVPSSGSPVELARLDLADSAAGSSDRLRSSNSYVYDEHNPPSYNDLLDLPADAIVQKMPVLDGTLNIVRSKVVNATSWYKNGTVNIPAGFQEGDIIYLYVKTAGSGSVTISSAIDMWPDDDSANKSKTHTITGNYLITLICDTITRFNVHVTPI